MSDNKNKFIESGKKFSDPNIDRKKKMMDESFTLTKDGFPLPANIEISNSGVCNRKCSFCPRSDPDFEHINEFFPNDVHDKLCQELAEHNYKGIFSYCGFNEPLLKKDIYRDIKAAKKYFPGQSNCFPKIIEYGLFAGSNLDQNDISEKMREKNDFG